LDGRAVVFVGAGAHTSLWLRRLDSLSARELPGTAGAAYPFWSPNGRWVGFFAEGKLKKIDITGGPPAEVTDGIGPRGGSWSTDDMIIFALTNGPILKVPASGGTPVPVTRLDRQNEEVAHRWPQLLPDGHHVLYFVPTSRPNRTGIYVGSLDRPDEKTFVVASTTRGLYSPAHGGLPGRLLWVRGSTLMTQTFDLDTGHLTGEPMVVPGLDRVGMVGALGGTPFWLSNEGTLIYSGADDEYPLTWFGRDGQPLQTVASGRYTALRLSPEGGRVAVSVLGDTSYRDLWTMELERGGVPTRLTTNTGNVPVWSPDGSRVAYHDSGPTNIFIVAVNSDDAPKQLLHSDTPVYVNDWSPDGQWVLYTKTSPATGSDLWKIAVDGDRNSEPVLVTSSDESHGQFSPDGKWLAFTSNQSGQEEIFVRKIGGTKSTPVSTSGGSFARWRQDSHELFYRALDGMLIAIPVSGTGDTPTFGEPNPLFKIVEPLGSFAYPYDVSPNGQRVLTLASSGRENLPLTVLVNWEASLRTRVAQTGR
jgi:Tol biopolymer transport system component